MEKMFRKLHQKVAFFLVIALLSSCVWSVDRHKFKKCDDSSFCRRHRSIDPNAKPFKYSMIESSFKLDGSKFTALIEEAKSKTQLLMTATLFEPGIVHILIDEANPLNQNRRYRVSDVIVKENQEEAHWKSWDPKSFTLETNSGQKVVLDPSTFSLSFFQGNSKAVTLNQRGLLYLEPLGMPKPEQSAAHTNRHLNDLQEGESNDGEGTDNEEVEEFGPDGNRIVGRRTHVGAVNRDLESDDSSSDYSNNHEGDRELLSSVETDDMNAKEGSHPNIVKEIDMNGAWEEHFGGARDSKPRGPESMGMDITFHGSNHVYGIPEHAIGLDLPPTKGNDASGNAVNRDPYRLYNLDVFEYELNSEMSLYGAVPLLYSHDQEKTSAVFWLNAAETWIDIEKPTAGSIHQTGGVIGTVLNAFSNPDDSKDKEDRVLSHWMSESGAVELYVLLGANPKAVIEKYRILTGSAQLPPLSSIAHHQCRWNYKDIDDVLNVNQGFEKHEIPMDYIWLDIEHTDAKKYFTWDKHLFDDPERMLQTMQAYGRKMVTIIDPHIKRDSGYHIHSEATSKGYYVKNHVGVDYDGHCWPGSSSYLDFLNPEVRRWWASLFKYEQYQGSSPNLFTWNDMNEPSVFSGPEVTMPKDNIHHGNTEHRHIHNQYGYYMHLSTAEGHIARDNIAEANARKRPFVLTRSFFAGSQRNGAVWTGDNAANWEHLKISLPMIMSLGMGGITFSGADVGGFFKDAAPELMARWYQAGAFYPFFRAHGHIDTKRREPWIFQDPYLSVMREAVRMRYSLLPYWYTQFYEAHIHLTPIMRPLFIEYPQDKNTFGIENQFLVGSDLLVHPVTTQGATTVDVYLPGSETQTWYSYYDFHPFKGGRTITVQTPLEYIPIFIRGGSVIPRKDTIRRSTSQMKNDPYTLIVALDEKFAASGSLYLDDGESFQFEAGQFEILNFAYTARSKDTHRFKVSKAPNSGSYKTNNLVNRIIVAGVQRMPTKIALNVSGQEQQLLNFEYGQSRNILIIRRPNTLIDSDWYIDITF